MVEMSRNAVIKHYLLGYFWIDIISSVPSEFILFLINKSAFFVYFITRFDV